MSNFREAAKLVASDVRCPKCQSIDLPAPAKPTLEREQNGSFTCCSCGCNFTPLKREN